MMICLKMKLVESGFVSKVTCTFSFYAELTFFTEPTSILRLKIRRSCFE